MKNRKGSNAAYVSNERRHHVVLIRKLFSRQTLLLVITLRDELSFALVRFPSRNGRRKKQEKNHAYA